MNGSIALYKSSLVILRFSQCIFGIDLCRKPQAMSDIEGDQPSSLKCPSPGVNEAKHNTLTDEPIPSSPSETSQDDEDCHGYGRVKAYLTVFGAFLALFCTFGQMNSFGTYQTWYKAHQLQHLPPSTISWIGSLQLWVFFFSVCPVYCLVASCLMLLSGRPNRPVIRHVWPNWLNGYGHDYLHVLNNDD